jgi:hypothetical protein
LAVIIAGAQSDSTWLIDNKVFLHIPLSKHRGPIRECIFMQRSTMIPVSLFISISIEAKKSERGKERK